MTVIAFIIVLGILVFVHELGHFLAARRAGAKVEVFSIGFGKPIIKWKDRKNTEWRIAWLPLGGFVKIYGQDDMFDRGKYNSLPAKEKFGHYLSLPAWKQAVVVSAGVIMNLLLAWVIFSGILMGPQTVQLPVIGKSESAALKPGDRIMQIDGRKISSWQDLLMSKEMNIGKDSGLVLLRGDKLVRTKMPAGKWGVSPNTDKTEIIRHGFFGAVMGGAEEVWRQSKMMVVFLKQMISGERSTKQLGGVIYIADLSGKALAAGILAMLSFIAMLSVNLAVINLFPLPITDGGFLLILAIEGIVRRKLQGKAMDWIMRGGWALFALLVAFTVWNDVLRMIAK